jgi:D-amino-acid dehydrogenase
MSKHILVIGGGIIGLSTAYYASGRGHRVTIVERGPATHDGCSFGNAGYITPSHFIPLAAPGIVPLALRWMANPESPFYVRPRLSPDLISWGWKFWRASTRQQVERAAPLLAQINLASRALYEELAGEADDFGFTQRGLLIVVKSDHALEEEAHVAELAHRLGMPAEIIDARAVAALEPEIRMAIAGAAHYPRDAHFAPAKLMASLTRRLEERGVELAWHTNVTGWRAGRDRVEAVRTSRGDLSADEYVVSGGSWSPSIVRDLRLKLPMQGGKGYSLTLANPPRNARRAIILGEARVAVTPLGAAIRFGGTMEIAGLQERVNPARVRGIIKAVMRYFPEFTGDDFRGVEPWYGFRPCSPDGLPYVGRFARYANLSAATGHAMMGMSLGPITGKLMSEVLSGERPSIDISMLSPDRYA